MSSIIKDFFKGLQFLFGKEFRYYTISYIIITLILSITAFNLFQVDPRFSLTSIMTISFAFSHSFLLLGIFTFIHKRIRDFLLESKWRIIISPTFAIFGTIFFFFLFNSLLSHSLIIYLQIMLLICIYLWLIFQSIGINLFSKFSSKLINESISNHKWKIFFNVIFCVIGIIFAFLEFPIINELNPHIKKLYPFYPVNSLYFISLFIVFTMIIITVISLVNRNYSAGFYISGFFLICYLYLFYIVLRMFIYIQTYIMNLIPAISMIDIIILYGTLIYTLQSLGSHISRGNKSVFGLLFIIFSVSWIYQTWYISTLMVDAISGINITLSQLMLNGISDFSIFIFTSFLSIVLGILFYIKYLKNHREYIAIKNEI